MKRTVNIDYEEQTIKLLNEEDIQQYVEKYKYIHIGLIQVAYKALTLQGLNASILSFLRDARCLSWTSFLVGIMQKFFFNRT